jgi:L-2-hydroxyglutarate oxidase LhgO
MADFGAVVVGAGVVGLAIGERLARTLHDGLVVLERRPRHGQETSSRNSEVIHAGIYYPAGSLKARLCVEGNRLLYELCGRHGIAHARLGKVVTAVTAAELPALDALRAKAAANGVALDPLTAEQVHALEPHVQSVGGLLSPTSGIVSAHELMDFYAHALQAHGGLLQTHSEVVGLGRSSSDWTVSVRTPDGVDDFTTERVINAAGLDADRVAALAGIDVDAAGYRLHWCRGRYFSAPGRHGLARRLVYPVPGSHSLGVHVVLDLVGRLRFGPDVEFLAERTQDYAVDPGLRPLFAESVRRLFPQIEDHELEPDMAGIRPKLQGPGDAFRDFVIADEEARGLPGLLNLVGIESPGLTAAPAIAAQVNRGS